MGHYRGGRRDPFGLGNSRGKRKMIVTAGLPGTGLALLLLAVLAGCGGASSPVPDSMAPAAAKPAGVADLAAVLQSELLRLGVDPGKVAATAPDGEYSAVFDLAAVPAPGTAPFAVELSWTEQACGDYDQDGEVGVSDLTPLAVHWMKQVAYVDGVPAGDPEDDGAAGDGEPPAAGSGAENWRLARIDGNHDGVLNTADVTPIAVHWKKRLDGYRVYQRLAGTQVWTLLGDLALRPAMDPTRPVRYRFITNMGEFGSYEYQVLPYDEANADEGVASNIAAVTLDPGDVWRMYGHDERHTFCSTRIGPETPALKWKFLSKGVLNSDPVYPCTAVRGNALSFILAEDLYTLDDQGCTMSINASRVHEFGPAVLSTGGPVSISYAFDSSAEKLITAYRPDGTMVWEYSIPFLRYFPPVAGPDDTVYVAQKVDSAYDTARVLTAVDKTGQLRYSTTMPGSIVTVVTPGPSGEVYYGYRITDTDTQVRYYSLSRMGSTGNVEWDALLLSNPTVTGCTQPAVRPDGVVLMLVSNQLFAVSPGGMVQWSLPVALTDPAELGTICLAADSANCAYLLFSTLLGKTLLKAGPNGEVLWTRELYGNSSAYGLALNDSQQQVCCFFASERDGTDFLLFNTAGAVSRCAHQGLVGTQLFSDAQHYYLVFRGGIMALDQELVRGWFYGKYDCYWSPTTCAPDGSIYMMDLWSRLHKLDTAGNELWNKAMYYIYYFTLAVKPSPAVDDSGTLYLAGIEEEGLCALYSDGSYKWRTDNNVSLGMSPVCKPDGLIYTIGATDEERGSALLGYNPDGAIEWMSHDKLIHGISMPYCTLDTRGLPLLSDFSGLQAFTKDGAERWRIPEGLLGTFNSYAAVAVDGTIYFPIFNELYAISTDGKVLWSYSLGIPEYAVDYFYIGQGAAVTADGSVVIACTDGRIIKLKSSGEEVWTYRAPAAVTATPAIDGAGTVYAGCVDGKLYAITTDGVLKWEYQASGPINASPSIGNDGSILFGSDDGCFYALGPGQG